LLISETVENTNFINDKIKGSNISQKMKGRRTSNALMLSPLDQLQSDRSILKMNNSIKAKTKRNFNTRAKTTQPYSNVEKLGF